MVFFATITNQTTTASSPSKRFEKLKVQHRPSKMVEMIVRPYHWEDASAPVEEDQVPLRVWALDRDQGSVCLRIEDFPNFYYVQLPRVIGNRPVSWTEVEARQCITEIANRVRDFSSDWIIDVTFIPLETLFYYKLDPRVPMVRICFSSMKAGSTFARKLGYEQYVSGRSGKAKFTVLEEGIPIQLKLQSIQKITPCQWLRVTGETMAGPLAKSTSTELVVRYQDLIGIPDEETSAWPFLPMIMGVDGEMYSSNPKAMPNQYKKSDVCFMWSCVWKRYKAPKESTQRRCIVLGPSKAIPEERLSNAEIITVASELELVDAYARLVQEANPDVIVGFNIYSFDNPYLNHRVERNLQPLPVFGRIKGERAYYTEKQWESKAFGEMTFGTINMTGRIVIDLLPYFKREFKLQRYNLDTLAEKFIGEKKNDMSAKQMFATYAKYLSFERLTPRGEQRKAIFEEITDEMTEIALYCIQDSEILLKLIDQINLITNITELANVVRVNPLSTITAGQTQRCISQIYYHCSNVGIVIDKRETETKSFKGGAVAEPRPGLNDLTLCWDCASMYPSIIRAYNIDYTTLIPEEIIQFISPGDYHLAEFDQEEEDDREERGEEEEDDDNPKPKKKKEKVVKHYRYYWHKKKKGVLPTLVENLVTRRNDVRRVQKRVDRDIKELRKLDGELAELLQIERTTEQDLRCEQLRLTAIERAAQIFELQTTFDVLEARQLGLKVSGNSMYGFIGASFGLPLQEGSRTVTAFGRQVIGKITEYVQVHYQGVDVYGDTDSTMMQVPHITRPSEMAIWGKTIADEINFGIPPGKKDMLGRVIAEGRSPLLPPPMMIEYEKGMRIACFKKKKYAALLYEDDGSFKKDPIKNREGVVVGYRDTMLTRGIVMARRDNCQYLRDTYNELLYDVLHLENVVSSMNKLFLSVKRLLSGEIGTDEHREKLMIVKSCRGHYKQETNSMNVFINNLKRDGKIVNPGDRLEYYIVKGTIEKMGHKMRSTEQFAERYGSSLSEELDYVWYVKHLMNPLNQLMAIGYHKEIDYLREHFYLPFRTDSRHKTLFLDEPMRVMFQLATKGHDINEFWNWFVKIIQRAQR